MPNDVSRQAESAAGNNLSDILFQNIARQIKDGSCVLFLGPAAVSAKFKGKGLEPLTERCAAGLAAGLDLSKEETRSLTQVCSSLRIRNTMSDTSIIAAVQDFYQKAENDAEMNPLLQKLADLPFKIIINTTPDDFFARFYAETVREFRFDYYNFRKPNPDPLYQFGEDDPPLIYNLFGFYEKPESLVLTYGDQLAYVNKITGAQHERLPDSLLAAFNVPRFYLFLGFDFEDWSLKVLLDALFKNARNNIQPFAYPSKQDLLIGPEEKVFFKGEFKMEFPEIDMENFVEQLLEHYKKLDDEGPSDAGMTKADVLVLHNEATDDAACEDLIRHFHSLKVKIHTLRDAVGAGDLGDWINEMTEKCQIVIPLLSADFFSDDNPALPYLEEIAKKNNPRKKFLVMPLIVKPVSLEGTAVGKLRTTRPLNDQSIYGEDKEDQHFSEITETLRKYIDTLK